MGLVFALLTTLSYALIVLVGHVEKYSNNFVTLNLNEYNQLPVDHHWVMIPQMVGIIHIHYFTGVHCGTISNTKEGTTGWNMVGTKKCRE